jgi:probable rRNA maturation factor
VTRVHFNWERRPSQPAAKALRAVVAKVLRVLETGDCEVHVLITGDDHIRHLNREYRSRDRATDVLSFADGERLPSGRVLLGQIVVSLDAARRQAAEMAHDELRELEELLLHGTLHLLGYDHVRDQGRMNALEMRLRQELFP